MRRSVVVRILWAVNAVIGAFLLVTLIAALWAASPPAEDCPVRQNDRGGNPTAWIVGRKC